MAQEMERNAECVAQLMRVQRILGTRASNETLQGIKSSSVALIDLASLAYESSCGRPQV